MKHTVAKFPKVNTESEGIKILALLDLGSDVLLLHQIHFQKII